MDFFQCPRKLALIIGMGSICFFKNVYATWNEDEFHIDLQYVNNNMSLKKEDISENSSKIENNLSCNDDEFENMLKEIFIKEESNFQLGFYSSNKYIAATDVPQKVKTLKTEEKPFIVYQNSERKRKVNSPVKKENKKKKVKIDIKSSEITAQEVLNFINKNNYAKNKKRGTSVGKNGIKKKIYLSILWDSYNNKKRKEIASEYSQLSIAAETINSHVGQFKKIFKILRFINKKNNQRAITACVLEDKKNIDDFYEKFSLQGQKILTYFNSQKEKNDHLQKIKITTPQDITLLNLLGVYLVKGGRYAHELLKLQNYPKTRNDLLARMINHLDKINIFLDLKLFDESEND